MLTAAVLLAHVIFGSLLIAAHAVVARENSLSRYYGVVAPPAWTLHVAFGACHVLNMLIAGALTLAINGGA